MGRKCSPVNSAREKTKSWPYQKEEQNCISEKRRDTGLLDHDDAKEDGRDIGLLNHDDAEKYCLLHQVIRS